MKKYIEQLKEKPEPVRKQIALVGAIIGSGIILIFWITTMSFDAKNVIADSKEKIVSPLSMIRENAKDTYDGLKASVQIPVAPSENIESIPTVETVDTSPVEEQTINY